MSLSALTSAQLVIVYSRTYEDYKPHSKSLLSRKTSPCTTSKDYKPHFFSIEEYSIFVSMAQFRWKVFRALARVVNHFEVTIYIFRSLES